MRQDSHLLVDPNLADTTRILGKSSGSLSVWCDLVKHRTARQLPATIRSRGRLDWAE